MIRNLDAGYGAGRACPAAVSPPPQTRRSRFPPTTTRSRWSTACNTVPANPPPDTVTILDIGVSPPKVLGELQAPSSVVGVPQSVAVVQGRILCAGDGAP